MKIINCLKLFILSVLIFENCLAVEKCTNALTTHIEEAIAHNKNFKQIYFDLSDGDSENISRKLIIMEKIALLYSKQLDAQAAIYQENDIPVLCKEISSMDLIKASTEITPLDSRPKYFIELNIHEMSSNLKKLIKVNKFDQSLLMVQKILVDIESNPEQLCLTRHFLESIAITLKLIPIYKEMALAKGLDDPTYILKRFLKIQRMALAFNFNLDKTAFPLQQKGIPILCNDIPPINWK